MKQIVITSCELESNASWEMVARQLESATWHAIDVVNWPTYNYRPWVQFRMTYSASELLLEYRVREKYIRAKAKEDNGEVWKDSCVEFFVSPDSNDYYYNFEFNCAGVCLLHVGAANTGRGPVSNEAINQVRRLPSLGRNSFEERKGDVEWNMKLVIPFTSFSKHPGFSPTGKTMRANFYKCGDELTEPHFLSWNPIDSEKPQFHRPEFFGQVVFA